MTDPRLPATPSVAPHGPTRHTGRMSNLERDPDELVCTEGTTDLNVEILAPREVTLGGSRAMLVRRALPQRQRPLIGDWGFVDHYGPDARRQTDGTPVTHTPQTRHTPGRRPLPRERGGARGRERRS